MRLANAGTITANRSTPLLIDTSNGFTNNGIVQARSGASLTVLNDATGTTNSGTMEATIGGTLALIGNSLNNTGGTIQAATASTVSLENGVIITGGTLSTTGATGSGYLKIGSY
jgi:hypothetical protein